jgi:hypothetical protein
MAANGTMALTLTTEALLAATNAEKSGKPVTCASDFWSSQAASEMAATKTRADQDNRRKAIRENNNAFTVMGTQDFN